MTIPKGIDYGFTITVVEKDSFLPQDLQNMDIANSTFKLFKLADLCLVAVGTTTITRPADVTYSFEDATVTTAVYAVDDVILDTVTGLVYKCIQINTIGISLTDIAYFTEVTTYLDGKINVLLDATLTDSLSFDRGEAVDNYYLKPTYQGVINIKFTDDTPERTAIIEKIYIAPTGVVCV